MGRPGWCEATMTQALQVGPGSLSSPSHLFHPSALLRHPELWPGRARPGCWGLEYNTALGPERQGPGPETGLRQSFDEHSPL